MLQKNAAPGIHRVEDAYVNWYLVEDGPRLAVVDTGLPRSWRSLHRALLELGRSPGQIDAVVLTHGHFDHMGFAERARTELGVPVWSHELEVSVTRHPWRYEHERSRVPYFVRYPRFPVIFAAMGVAGALWVKGLGGGRPFRDEGELDVPGRPTVVFSPGHTYGHCAFHLPDRGALLSGDALVTLNPYTGDEGPRIVAGAATADSRQALASLDRLAATGARTVLPGHGAPVDAGRSARGRARPRGRPVVTA